MEVNKIIEGNCLDVLKTLPDKSINCCVTSPPYYGLRDYGHGKQIGMEETPELFAETMTAIFAEVKRVLKDDGVLWLNLGDSYCSTATGSQGKNLSTLQGSKQTQIEAGKRPDKSKLSGLKQKDLIGIPWMVAFALRANGWYLRQDIIWNKPNPMPESVTDRCTKSHEYIFLLSKSKQYFYDAAAIEEPCVWDTGGMTEKRVDRAEENHKAMPTVLKNGIRPKKKGPQTFGGKKARDGQDNGGDPRNGHRTDENSQWGKVWNNEKPTRNKRTVWTVATKPFREAHFATFPEELIYDCIKAGCPENGIVLDPFMGAGTTGLVARKLNRNFVGIELNPEYIEIAESRLSKELGMFA